MGAAATYGALAVSGIASTGATVITGDIGTVEDGLSGFPPGIVVGTEADSSAASEAHADAVAAFDSARNLTATQNLGPTALDVDITLTAGVYSYEQAASIAAVVTLDGPGTFVFQIPSGLSTTIGSQVLLTGGATASDVYWTVGFRAVLGANSTIVGSVIVEESITVAEGATIVGGLYSGAAITLADTTIM